MSFVTVSYTHLDVYKRQHIISVDEKRFDSDNRSEDYQAYENLVKETIDYESLEVTQHDDMQMCIRDRCLYRRTQSHFTRQITCVKIGKEVTRDPEGLELK